jgi:opacity protein-like surface antigen
LDDNWKLGLDYTYTEFKHKTFDATGSSYQFASTPEGKATYTFSSRGFDHQMLALTLKYRF